MPSTVTSTASVETELLRRLTDIEKQITDLEAERKAVQRLLVKVRSDNAGVKDVTRRNSLSRIIIEHCIIETSTNSGTPVPSTTLFRQAKAEVRDLKENTFRSHLHRMKAKGLIEPLYSGGPWRLRPPKL